MGNIDDQFFTQLADLIVECYDPPTALLKVFDLEGPDNLSKTDVIYHKTIACMAIFHNSCGACDGVDGAACAGEVLEEFTEFLGDRLLESGKG